MDTPKSQPSVLWKRVLGLTAIQTAIALTWLVYGLYLPTLLGQFGFPPQLAGVLLVVENGIAIILEPLAGGISDRSLRWLGTRFPFISVGVILASALFIAIPTLGIFASPGTVTRWMVIFVLVAWAIAMTLFRSPALSLLRRYSSIKNLPLATSLLTLATGLIGTAKPLVNEFILSFGPAVAFAVGSIALLGTTAVLRSIDPPTAPTGSQDTAPPPFSLSALGLIAGVGLSVGWGTRVVMDNFGKVFSAQFPNANIGQLMLAIGIGLVVMTIPAGILATRLGNRRMLCLGLLLTIGFSGLMAFLPVPVVLALSVVALVISLSLVQNSVVPFALAMVPTERAGLGVGMYFGAASAAVCLFGIIVSEPGQITPILGVLMAAIAFFIAILCIVASPEKDPQYAMK